MKRHFVYGSPVIVENVFLFVPGRPVQVPGDHSTASCSCSQNVVYEQTFACNQMGNYRNDIRTIVLPSMGFQATSMLDEFCTLDVLPQRKLTHSLKPLCSTRMRNTLNTVHAHTGKKNVSNLRMCIQFIEKTRPVFTISAGNHDVCVLLVQRQRVRGTFVQNESLAVGGHVVP